MKLVLGMAVVLNFLGVANTSAATSSSEFLPFIGTLLAGILTSGVAYLAYKHSRKAEKRQDIMQENVTALEGFSSLTRRLQETVEQQDEKLQELQGYHDSSLVIKLASLEQEIAECNRDRIELRVQLEGISTEIRILRERVKHEVGPENR